MVSHADDLPGYEEASGHPRGAVAALRLAARKYAGTKCVYQVRCREAEAFLITVDHVVPRDGSVEQHDLANLVVACDACNSHKGRKTLAQWLLETGPAATARSRD